MPIQQGATLPIHNSEPAPGFLRQWFPPILLTAICLLGIQGNYLAFHLLAELASIVIAFTALIVANTSYEFTKNHFVIFVSIVIGWCAGIDLVHTLTYKGMGIFPLNESNVPIQLWIVARSIQAAGLLIALFFLHRPIELWKTHLVFGCLSFIGIALVVLGYFPVMYIDGKGLTPIKIGAEYLIIALLLISLTLLWKIREAISKTLLHNMSMALLAMMLSEFAFTQYVSVYAESNLIGHVLKIFAYWFLYLALVQRTLREPFVLVAKSERRFKEVFDSSPTPMVIYTLPGRAIANINRSFHKWLGYDQKDIGSDDEWYAKVYVDPVIREQIRQQWPKDIAEAKLHGKTIQTPEAVLRTKDGASVISTATMTIVNGNVVVAWTDLTAIREKEAALAKSAANFKSMIEQSAAGIYVRRDAKFVYVNPRYCRILGYESDELLGKEIYQFTTSDPENLKKIRDAWAALDMGQEDVTYTVPVRRKDGVMITLELHAKRIDWDGAPADIVLADDVTEREHQKERIARYVKQLEGSMQATLEAVSNMVEMRDPYTAGHERRVGIIACDIAREMGWPDERSEPLKMIGLVHDIGKISIPAEILTKPSVLTALEMALIRSHAQASYEILKDVPFPIPVAEIIWQHHERIDGSGYPLGLKGDAILPEARILAVADTLESMSSHRPYRPAKGIDAAVKEIEDQRGKLYDADVVDAALRLLRQKRYRLPD